MKVKQIKRVLITGGTSGLGLEVVKLLLNEGHTVCTTGRRFNENSIGSDHFFFVKADFSKLAETAAAVNKITEMIGLPDIIINNAGILSPPGFLLSDDGFELSYQVNFLSHLILNDLFIRKINKDQRMLIISVTSPVYRYVKPGYNLPVNEDYSPFKVYAESKLYMVLMGKYLAQKYPEKNICFIGFNPGTFRSGIYRLQKKYFHKLYHIAAPFMKSPVKVAGNLLEIIENKNLIAAKVYSSPAKLADIKVGDMEEAIRFFSYCNKNVADFLK